MSFKFLFLLILLFGCGVKGDPIAPQGAQLPSFLEDYPEIKTESFDPNKQKKQ